MAEASQLPPFPPIDLNSYKWNQAEGDPSLWQRRACGVEALVGIEKNMAKGEYDLFYALTAELHDKKHTLGHVKTAARAAWRLLRYQQPQIACTAASDHQIKALLQYRVPKDDDEVMAWTERTVLVEASDRTPMEIRNANEEERKQKNLGASESATIYLAASVKDETTPLDATELRVLFRVNHVFFDGIGFRCMIACFFRGLAQQLSNNVAESNASLDWSTSAANLTPSYVNLLVPEQHISGPEYDSSLQQQAGELMRGVANWGLEPKSYFGDGASKTLWRTFTKEESQRLLQAVKQRLGPGHTITHLGMSALLLALLKMHPPGPEVQNDRSWLCTAPVNARAFIKEPYQSYRELYFPACQANGFAVFDDMKSFAQDGQREDEKTKELLARASRQAKNWLEKLRTRPHSLALATSIMEMITTINAEAMKTSAPMFTSYGVQEKYLPRDYTAAGGGKVVSIKDVHFWLNMHASFP
ncbi:MAG: hypothetical protein LQ341_001775 [Variospora aurantia]|nr:MAG: hypothetical protein LQ341_001775 [Variospora aurantia]